MLKILILLALSCFSSLVVANSLEKVKVNIYYYDWDLRTRSRVSIDNVRENYFTYIEIINSDQVKLFSKSLPVMKKLDNNKTIESSNIDVRLVIDFTSKDGTVETIFASRFFLFSLDGTHKIKIDKSFRDIFKIYVPKVELE